MPPEEYRNVEEKTSVFLCYENFFSENLQELFFGVSLAEWIRAYSVIKQECLEFISNQNDHLREWLIIKSKHEWISLFKSGGIKFSSAEVIFEKLLFNEAGRDLLDCPFIPIEDVFIVVPALSVHINASNSIFSNMAKKDQISFKGLNFEKIIRKIIRESGIECCSLRIGKYECDVIFVIDEELFIIECKSRIQPYSIREHAHLRDDISFEISKFNKNADFYSSNLQHIRNKFNFSKNWQPINIHRVFLITPMLGGYRFEDGCHVTDSTILVTFLSKMCEKPEIRDVSLTSHYFKELTGEITAKKLMNFIKNPGIIELFLKQCKTVEHVCSINGYEFHMPGFVKFTPDVVVVNKDSEQAYNVMNELKEILS